MAVRTYRTTEAQRAAAKRAQLKYPERYKARHLFAAEVNSGRILRQPCEMCGSPRSDAHHPDYAKPLEVQWLCRAAHLLVHYRMKLRRQRALKVYGPEGVVEVEHCLTHTDLLARERGNSRLVCRI